AYLLANRERLVTRDEVFEKLWAGREVLDASLSNHIKSARAVLGDDGETQCFIKTYRSRGYQFIADVEVFEKTDVKIETNNTSKPSVRTASRWMKIGGIVTVFCGLLIFSYWQSFTKGDKENSVTSMHINQSSGLSLAVLPFKNRSNNADDIFFTDGIHDDLLSQIAKIHSIKTISRTSVMGYRDSIKNIRTIAKELGVTSILEGGVQRAGDEIRINVQLIDAVNDVHIWSETYTRQLNVENVFSIQSEIAYTVAKKLETVLTAKQQQQLNTLPTNSMAALEAYFLAKIHADKGTHSGIQQAIEQQSRAIQLDPNFANAYARLASLQLGQIYWSSLPAKQQISIARPLIDKAMQLNSELSEAYTALGSLKIHENDFKDAKLAFQQAIKLNPNNAQAYRTFGEFYQHQIVDHILAAEYLAKASELDPNSDSLSANLAQILVVVGRIDEARKMLEGIIQRNPNFAAAYQPLAFLYFYVEGKIAQTQRLGSRRVKLDPGAPVPGILYAWGYIHAGEYPKAIEWLNYEIKHSNDAQNRLATQALIYDFQGNYSQAFDTYLAAEVKSDHEIYRLMKTGLWSNRADEVLEFTKNAFPELFTQNAKVDSANFSTALVLGTILKSKGELKQANYLLAGVLKVVKLRKYGWWEGRYNNWLAQCYLAMNDNQAALKAFVKTAEEGFHSEYLIADPIYKPLYNEIEYQRVIKIIKAELVNERKLLNQMEKNGEIHLPASI
ncbi:MAG: tetratricopeptide repeat protein, partial [Paraglaciecola sp.]|nr:tetratricopeptide repeat protein [Paraglaciecola sp.]